MTQYKEMHEHVVSVFNFLLPFNMKEKISGQDFAALIRKYSSHPISLESADFAEKNILGIKKTPNGVQYWMESARITRQTVRIM